MKIHTIALGLSVALTGLAETSVRAALITELEFTNGPIALRGGSSAVAFSNFTQHGTFNIGRYQPLPNIIPLLTLGTSLGTYTFSLSTSGPNPFSISNSSGSSISADLVSLALRRIDGTVPPVVRSVFAHGKQWDGPV